MTAEQAAELIQHGDVLGMGGFTATGVPKAVPFALAQRAVKLHEQGIPFRVGLETGASMGDSCDGALARAHAVEFRTPYQSNKSMREEIDAEGTHYFDMHLSHMAQDLLYGFLPKPNWAIIEASYVGEDGTIVPAAGTITPSSPTYEASMMANLGLGRKPYRKSCAIWLRCISK